MLALNSETSPSWDYKFVSPYLVASCFKRVLSTKINLLQRDKGQGIGHKDGRQRMREEGKGAVEMGQGYFSWRWGQRTAST